MSRSNRPAVAAKKKVKAPSSKKASSAKKPQSAKKAPKPSTAPAGPLTPDVLFERVAASVRRVAHAEHAQRVGLAAKRCREAGRADLSEALVAALPKQFRADAAPEAAAVMHAALGAIQSADQYRLQQELAKLMSGGHHAEVRSVLSKVNDEQRAMLERLELTNGELAVLSDQPELVLSIVEGLSHWPRVSALEAKSTIEALATWPRAQLLELAKRVSEPSVTRLGAAVAALGRADDARALLFPEGGPQVTPRTQTERLGIVGDHAKLDAFIAEPNLEDFEWTRLRIARGVDTVAGTLAKIEASPSPSVMADVASRHRLAGVALERGDLAGFDAILSSIDLTLQRPERTDYDRGMEASTLASVDDLRVQRALAAGDAAGTKELLEKQLAGLGDLMKLAEANERDPSQRKFSKGMIAQTFAVHAGKAGHPALGLTAGLKLSPAERERLGASVASVFLPNDPAGALAAFEAMTGKNGNHVATSPSFFTDLWQATLGSGPG